MKQIANFLSYVFHPLFVPIYGLLILMYTSSTPESFLIKDSLFHIDTSIKHILLFLFGIFGVIAPGVSLLLFRYNHTITSLNLEIREERRMPIFMMAVYMAILYGFLLYQIPQGAIPPAVVGIALGAAIGIALTGLLNNYFKISLHMIGMGMLSGAIYSYYLFQVVFPTWILPLIFMISGIVAMSRLTLKAHTYSELISGFLLGFATQAISVYFYLS